MKEILTRTTVLLACFAPFAYDLAKGVTNRGLVISGAFSLFAAFFVAALWPLAPAERGDEWDGQ